MKSQFFKKVNKKSSYIWLSILLVAFLLRVPGIFYGLPLIFNTDEPSYIGSVVVLRFSSDLNRFDWPHTHFYFGYGFFMTFYYFRAVINNLGLQGILTGYLPFFWSDPASYYMVLRFLNVVLGVLTIIPIYLSSKLLFSDKKYATLSAVIFGLIPLHVRESSLALLDIALTFWLSWFIYFSIKLWKGPSYTNFILSGIFMGLAFGTKYNAVFYLIFFSICVLFSVLTKNKPFSLFISDDYKKLYKSLQILFTKKYLLSYLLFLFSFLGFYLLTNYQVITNFNLFWSDTYGRGFLFQFDNIKNLPVVEIPQSLIKNIYFQPLKDLGVVFTLYLYIFWISFLFFRYRSKNTTLFALFPILMYFYISTKSRSPSHYFLFLFPLLVFSVVQMIKDFSNFAAKKLKSKVSIDTLFYLIIAPLLLSMVYSSVSITYKLTNGDTRNYLNEKMSDVYKTNLPIYYYGDSYYNLNFKSGVTQIKRLDDENVAINDVPFILIINLNGVSYDSMVKEMKSDIVRGWVSKFLTNSELIYYKDSQNIYGSPVFIFKVNKVLNE